MSGAVLALGVALFGIFISVLSVDAPAYFATQNQLQTAANAGALAGTQEIFRNTGNATSIADLLWNTESLAAEMATDNIGITEVNPNDVNVGYFDFTTGTFSTTPSASRFRLTNGYNSVQVAVVADESHSGQVPTVFANLLGSNALNTAAGATAALSNTIQQINTGLRPIYGCQAQWNLAYSDGNLENNVIRVYGDRFMMDGQTVTCPLPAPGNWGFADLRDCGPGSPGASTIADWFAEGFPGIVYANRCYSTNPGNFLSASGVNSAIDQLIADQTVITIPLINSFNGSGSNTNVNIVSFTGFVITDYKDNGPADSRYIEGYYTSALCRDECEVGGDVEGGVYRLKLVNAHS